MTNTDKPIMIEVSARHVHLCREHADVLFGKGYEFTIKRELFHPGQYIVEERVDLVTEKRAMKAVGILTPLRDQSQVEISMTDARTLGLKAPVKLSGDHSGTPGLTLIGPKGSLALTEGVIVAKRHIHMNPESAEKYGLTDKQIVSVKTTGTRPGVLEDVVVRISPEFANSMHIDTDEANALGIDNGDTGYILV